MRSLLAIVVWLSVFSVTALAAPEGAGGADGGHAKPDIFGRSLDLAIWTWVVFLLLFLFLRAFVWPKVVAGLKQREDTIQGALDEAKRVRAEAETIRAQLAAEMGKAHEKVRELLDEARRDGDHTKAEKVAEAEKQIQVEKDRSLREISTARDQALQELWNQSAQLATLISAKAIRRSLSENDHRGLVEEAVNELRGAVAGRG